MPAKSISKILNFHFQAKIRQKFVLDTQCHHWYRS